FLRSSSSVGKGNECSKTQKVMKLVGIPVRKPEENEESIWGSCPACHSEGECPQQIIPMNHQESLEIPGHAKSEAPLGGMYYSQCVVDIIDASIEDPFTLDTYEELMHEHAEKNKDFLLARVTTQDPKDETKFYHSYYNAHHINKILFRTRPEQ